MLLRTVLFFLVAFYPFVSEATHVMGSYISYEQVDSLKYKVSVTYYRDCRGVPFSKPSTRISGSQFAAINLDLTLESIQEIGLKPGDSTQCDPSNTYGTGNGIEKHIYSAVIDLTKSPYDQLLNYCEIIIESGQCCRSGAINSGPSGNFYNYGVINLCSGTDNSSVVMLNDPPVSICNNRPYVLDLGFKDTTEADSFSVSWGHPLSALNEPISYSGSYYAYNHPFSAYYPGSLMPPYQNYTATPSIGLYLDQKTGKVYWTPTRQDEVTVAVLEVKEWRKNKNDSMVNIGLTRFDMMYHIEHCPSETSPVIEGPYLQDICLGDSFSMLINSSFNYVLPDTSSTLDSIKMRYDGSIDGANFAVTNPHGRLQKGIFYWKPKLGDEDSIHQFDIIVTDNHGRSAQRTFLLKVHEANTQDLKVAYTGCGGFKLHSEHKLIGNYSMKWKLLDTAFKSLNGELWFSDSTSSSIEQNPIFTANDTGKFMIIGELTTSGGQTPGCSVLDTLELDIYPHQLVHKLDVDMELLNTGCTQFSVHLLNNDSIDSLLVYWQLYKKLGAESYTLANAQFKSSNTYYSSREFDEFTVFPHGEYKIWAKVTDPTTGCIATLNDHFTLDSNSVVDRVVPEPSVSKLGCGRFLVTNGSMDSVEYLWTMSRNGEQVGVDEAVFFTSQSDSSFAMTDSLTFMREGTYFLKLSARRTDSSCWSHKTVEHRAIPSNVYYNTKFDVILEDEGCGTLLVDVDGEKYVKDRLTSIKWEVFEEDSTTNKTASDFIFSSGGLSSMKLGDTMFMFNTSKTYLLFSAQTPNPLCSISADSVFVPMDSSIQNFTPHVVKSGTMLIGTQGLELDWYRNDTFVATADSLEMLHHFGIYRARYCNDSGCCSDWSTEYSHTASLQYFSPIFEVNIFPNPSDGKVYLRSQGTLIHSIRILDINGRLCGSEQGPIGQEMEITLPASNGLYIIEVETPQGVQRTRIVKTGSI